MGRLISAANRRAGGNDRRAHLPCAQIDIINCMESIVFNIYSQTKAPAHTA